MSKRIFNLLLAAALCGGTALAAQGRGQKPAHPQGQGRATVSQSGQKQGGGAQRGTTARRQQRIQVTQQQRKQLADCTQAGQMVRRQAGTMSRNGKGGPFDAAQARQQRDQLRSHTAEMLRQHERFMQSLGDAQRSQLQDRIRKMDQTRERLENCLQRIDREVDNPNPDPKRIRKEARLMKKETRKFQKQTGELDSRLVVQP